MYKYILFYVFDSVVQEAVGTGNPELLQMVLARRDYQRYCNRVAGIPELLHKLKQVSFFYKNVLIFYYTALKY